MKREHIGISLIAAPILISAAIALLLPSEIVDRPRVQGFIALSQFIFPTVEKMKGGYSLDGIALLYFSTMWILMPLTVIGGYISIVAQEEVILKSCKKNRWGSAFFAGLFFPAIIFIAFFANLESTDAMDARAYLTYQTRFGLAAMGFWIPREGLHNPGVVHVM